MPTRNEQSRVTPDDRSVAAGPKRIVWPIGKIASRDGHELIARFSATAMLAASSSDAAMVRETFQTDPSALTTDAVRDYFLGTVEPAMFNYLNRRDAASFDDSREVDLACEAIAAALQAAGFGAGVRFVPPFALTVESPSRQRQSLEAAARSRATQAIAHALSTLQQFQTLRDAQPNASVDQVLEQVEPGGAESLLPTLLRGWAERKTPSRIVVASGEQLISFSLDADAWLPNSWPTSFSIGPFRSVVRSQKGESLLSRSASRVLGETGQLLVGGQRGVAVLSLTESAAETVYRMPGNRTSQLGINGVAVGSTHLFATHSEFGLFVWPIDQYDAPRLLGHAQAKFATLIDANRCLFAANDQLFVTDGESIFEIAKPTLAGVVAILNMKNGAEICFADGTVANLASGQSQLEVGANFGGSVNLATPIEWLGERRLIIADDRGEVECVGPRSRLRYVSHYNGWRKIVAAADLVVALSLDRTRLVVWRPWEPMRPMGELHVASMTQHRVSDLTLI